MDTPMSYTLLDALSSFLATIAFGLLLLPPAYLFLSGTNLLHFKGRSGREQFLWVVSFSLPLTLFLSAIAGRLLSPRMLSTIFAGTLAGAVILIAARGWRIRRRTGENSPKLLPILLAMFGFAVYVFFITNSLQIHRRLYESVNYTDWSVRLPLVSSAIRNGIPPGNPFFTIGHSPQGSRYYYYWYVLCAQVGRPLHLPARACLTASAVWSGFALAAILLLYLKHLLGFEIKTVARALFPLLLCCVIGVDILPAFAGYLLHPPVLYPEMEWWLLDRIPSFLGAVIFAPHHIGGIVCCAFAFLVLYGARSTPQAGEGKQQSRQRAGILAGLTAGICFAACAGDSTYVALCFLIGGAFYGADLLRQRRWADLAILCASGLFAALCSLHLVREMTASLPAAAAGPRHMFQFALRNRVDQDNFASNLIGFTTGRVHRLLRFAVWVLLLPLQFGFFLLPLAMRVRTDFLRVRAGNWLQDGERLLWAIFLGAAIPAFFISSAPQGVNDLGRHAGLIMRFVLIVWAVPLLWPYVERWQWGKRSLSAHSSSAHPSPAHPWIVRFAILLFCLGIASQLWQIVSDRGLLPFLAHHPQLAAQPPVSQDADIGGRFFQIRQGLDLVEDRLPPDAIVQSNMGGRYQMLVMLYSSHPFVAGDVSCESAFGGDTRLCTPRVVQLQKLFGSSSDIAAFIRAPYHDLAAPDAAKTTTVAAFEQACRDLDMAAVLVQDSDPAWNVGGSWVWKRTPLYAAPTVRIFACPGAPA